jgi:AraC-like DNA-binding protein
MRKNQTALITMAAAEAEAATQASAIGIGPCVFEPRAAPEQAQRLRTHLGEFAARAGDGSLPLALPGAAGDEVARGDGHFHLASELFLQVSGWTRFRFPHGEWQLTAGQALLLPPKLLHAERVGATAADGPFCNLVIYADGASLSCHLAHETAPGRPGILHLEARRHTQAKRIHDWLSDAARLGDFGDGGDRRGHGVGGGGSRAGSGSPWAAGSGSPWAMAQVRALVAAATAGVLRALDEPHPAEPSEPALVARVRVLVQNQLGDLGLSVRRLAEQSGCTPDYLSHLFRRTTGDHLAGFIARQRMERAARLLGESAMAGKEVAWACGFATQSYFIRSFRAHFGVTPKAWRAGRAIGI